MSLDCFEVWLCWVGAFEEFDLVALFCYGVWLCLVILVCFGCGVSVGCFCCWLYVVFVLFLLLVCVWDWLISCLWVVLVWLIALGVLFALCCLDGLFVCLIDLGCLITGCWYFDGCMIWVLCLVACIPFWIIVGELDLTWVLFIVICVFHLFNIIADRKVCVVFCY